MDKEALIQKYIQGKVTEDELSMIRQLIQTDADFREDLAFESGLRQAIKKEEGRNLKNFLENLEQKSNEIPQPKSPTLRWLPMLGKVAALLVLALGVWWYVGLPVDHEDLYATYYEPYPNIVSPTVRGTDSTESSIAQAYRHYDNRRYSEAAALFEDLGEGENEAYVHFYLGQSLLAAGQVEQAITVLQDPNWEIPENLRNQTDWYLALALIKIGQTEQAIPLLQSIEKSEDPNRNAAQKLVKRIK